MGNNTLLDLNKLAGESPSLCRSGSPHTKSKLREDRTADKSVLTGPGRRHGPGPAWPPMKLSAAFFVAFIKVASVCCFYGSNPVLPLSSRLKTWSTSNLDLRSGNHLRRCNEASRLQIKGRLTPSDKNGVGDSEYSDEPGKANFDLSQLSNLSRAVPTPSQVDDTWKKLSKIYVLLFNARTNNEGICTIIIYISCNRSSFFPNIYF